MKKAFLIIFIICTGLAIFVAQQKKAVSKTFYAMGTNLTITIAEDDYNEDIFGTAFNEFKNVEKLFKGKLDLTNEQVKQVYNTSLKLQQQTNGVFSPYLADVISLWQFDKTNKTIVKAPSEQQIKQALKSKTINLYAIAKGYGIDVVANTLKQNNINNFIVNAGGDLYVQGTKFGKTWNVGLKYSNKIIACENTNYAIATSSNLYNSYEFNGKKYGHLINGNTGWPVNAEKTITIIAPTASIADGLATAIFLDETLFEKISKDERDIAMLKQDVENFSTLNLAKNCKVKKIGL